MAFNVDKSSNPAFSDKIFKNATSLHDGTTMSARGTMFKFGFLFLMVLATSALSWRMYDSGQAQTVMGLAIAGAVVGLVLALIMAFKPVWSHVLAPLYGLAEGFFIGGFSAMINNAFAESYPNIVLNAVGLTFGVVVAMFLLYNFRIIKVTQKLRSTIIVATMGIFFFYLIAWILGMFGVDVPLISGTGTFSIIFSVVVVGIAALNLLLDFDRIEEFSNQNAPKYMEWYCAFGLLVTIVWLYIEILRLLSKLASNRS